MTRKVLFCDSCKAEIKPDRPAPVKYTMVKESPLCKVALPHRVLLVTEDGTHLDLCRDCLQEIKLIL